MSASDCMIAIIQVGDSAPPKNRNIWVNGQRTSVRLEDTFWEALEDISAKEDISIGQIASSVSRLRKPRAQL